MRPPKESSTHADFLKLTGQIRYGRDWMPTERTPNLESRDEPRVAHLRVVTDRRRPEPGTPSTVLCVRAILSPWDRGEATADRAVPEGVTLLTRDDVPGRNRIGGARESELFPDPEIGYRGQVLGLLVGSCREQLDLVRAELLNRFRWSEGAPSNSVDEAVVRVVSPITEASADVRRGVEVTRSFSFPAVDPQTLEPEGGLAWMEGSTLHLQCSGSNGDLYRGWISEFLNLPLNQIVWHPVVQGGNFGSREYSVVPPLLALAAYRTGQAVAWYVDEEEKAALSKCGFGVSGTLTMNYSAPDRLSLRGEITVDLGSHFQQGQAMVERIERTLLGLYRFTDLQVRIRGVRTNAGPRGLVKGSGYTAATAMLEALMNDVAMQAQVDPVLFREQWIFDDPCGRELLRRLRSLSEKKAPADGESVGVGVALHNQVVPLDPGVDHAKIELTFRKGGGFRVRVLGDAITGGQKTALGKIVAEAFGVSPLDVDVETVLNSNSGGTDEFGKRLYLNSNAVWMAVQELKRTMARLAGRELGVSEANVALHFDHGVAVSGSHRIGLKELIFRHGEPTVTSEYTSTQKGLSRFAGAEAKLSLNRMTGEARVEELRLVFDSGKILEHELFEAQIHGAISWAMGIVFGEKGRGFFHCPSVFDLPLLIRIEGVSDPDRAEQMIVKGAGEGPQAVTVAAILSALESALGAQVDALPYQRYAPFGGRDEN